MLLDYVWKYSVLICGILVVVCSKGFAQIQNLNGVLGVEFNSQSYSLKTSESVYSKFSQVIDLNTIGYIYNPNLVSFSLNSSFVNGNTSNNYQGNGYKLNEKFYNFFDCKVDMLKSSNFPLSVTVKNSLNTNTVYAPLGGAYYNQYFSKSKGFTFSPKININGREKLNLFTLRYDDAQSESTNPTLPYEQRNQNLQLAIETPQILNTQFNIDLIYRNRNDNITARTYESYETYLRGLTQLNETDRISLNANYMYDNSIKSLYSNLFWNAQISDGFFNQVNGQFRSLKYSNSASSYEGMVNNQMTKDFSQNFSGTLILSHSEGASTYEANRKTTRNTLLSCELRFQKSLDIVDMNLMVQGFYNRTQFELVRNTYQGLFSAAFSTNGLKLGRFSLSDQFAYSKINGDNTITNLQNTAIASFETNIIRNLFFRSNNTYNINNSLGDLENYNRNIQILADVTYRWTKGINVFLSFNYIHDYQSNKYLTYSIGRYSVTVRLPNLIGDMSIAGRITKTTDPIRFLKEFSYDVVVTYTFRALSFSLRKVGYQNPSLQRSDLFFTVTRPININFE